MKRTSCAIQSCRKANTWEVSRKVLSRPEKKCNDELPSSKANAFDSKAWSRSTGETELTSNAESSSSNDDPASTKKRIMKRSYKASIRKWSWKRCGQAVIHLRTSQLDFWKAIWAWTEVLMNEKSSTCRTKLRIWSRPWRKRMMGWSERISRCLRKTWNWLLTFKSMKRNCKR